MKIHFLTWKDIGMIDGEPILYFYNPGKWIINYVNNQSLLDRKKEDLEIMQEKFEILTRRKKIRDNQKISTRGWKYHGKVNLPDELIEKALPLWETHEYLIKADKNVKEAFTNKVKSLAELVKEYI